jgi:hypothetical protein
VTLGMNSSLIQ